MKTDHTRLPATARTLIESALPLLLDASTIGDTGDFGGRCVDVSLVQLRAILDAAPGIRGENESDPLDMLHDAVSILEAVAALHPKCGRGLIVRVVADRLDQALDAIEFHQFEEAKPTSAELRKETPEQAFMEGKALAALLIQRSANHEDCDTSALPAGYRDDQAYVEQDNYARDIVSAVVQRPALLEGFSAALTHHLSTNSNTATAMDDAEWTAKISYAACRTKFGSHTDNDAYTEPPLQEQLRASGLIPAPVAPTVRKTSQRKKAVPA